MKPHRHVTLAFALVGIAAAAGLLIFDAARTKCELLARRAAGESDFDRHRRKGGRK